MVTISDNDLKQLLLYVQATHGKVQGANSNTRMYNRIRLAKITVQKLMKRDDVQRVMGGGKGVAAADK